MRFIRRNRNDLILIAIFMSAALIVSIAAGCARMQSIYPAPAAPVCAQPEYIGSVICGIGAYIGISPEQMDDMLLDASLVPVATRQLKAEQIRQAIAKIRVWVVDKDILTMQGIQVYLSEQAKLDPALALLISRRLPMFAEVPGWSIAPFLPVDRQMVIKHLDHQEAQFKLL